MIDPRFNTPETRLQFVFAKVFLTPEELAGAEALARQVRDWEAVFATAERKFSLPNMRMHLRAMAPGIVPPDLLERLENSANSVGLRNMTLVAEQRRFMETCMAPIGVEGVFFKGINLVAQYYPDMSLRPCRDIDIFVRPGDLAPVVRKAIDEGYSYVLGASGTELKSLRDIEVALAHCRDATLVSPDHKVVDVQIDLDKHSGIFAGEDLFAIAEPMALGGAEFLTLPPAFLFNYLSHHHSRHVWSRLHWLSDLDAMVRSDRFDPGEALSLADGLGQRGTVEASLQLQRLMAPDASWEPDPDTAHGQQFLDLCLRNLAGDLGLEKRIAINMLGGEFMYPWQARPDLIRRARWRRLWHVLHPTIEQYVNHPLPRWLHWLYLPPRIVELVSLARARSRKFP